MVRASAFVDMLVHVFFLKIEESTGIIRVAANEISKGCGSYLRYYGDSTIELQKITYFKCIHLFHVPASVGAS